MNAPCCLKKPSHPPVILQAPIASALISGFSLLRPFMQGEGHLWQRQGQVSTSTIPQSLDSESPRMLLAIWVMYMHLMLRL